MRNFFQELRGLFFSLFKGFWVGICLLSISCYSWVSSYSKRRRNKKFLRFVEESERFLPWNKLVKKLHSQDSTFITSNAHSRFNRVWWTQLNLLSMYEKEHHQEVKSLNNLPNLVEGWTNPSFHRWVVEGLESSTQSLIYLTETPLGFPAQRPSKISAYIADKWPGARLTIINLSATTLTRDTSRA
jgi:hypothetical protein